MQLYCADQTVSSIDLQENIQFLLDQMVDGTHDSYVATQANKPVAVLLSTANFEAVIEELDDLHIDAIAA